jgi:hypothetical protein
MKGGGMDFMDEDDDEQSLSEYLELGAMFGQSPEEALALAKHRVGTGAGPCCACTEIWQLA